MGSELGTGIIIMLWVGCAGWGFRHFARTEDGGAHLAVLLIASLLARALLVGAAIAERKPKRKGESP